MIRWREIGPVLRRMAPVLVVLGLYGAVALILCDLPLFGVLGYESSFVTGLVGSFASLHLSIVHVHRLRLRRADPLRSALTPLGGVLRLYGRVVGVNLLLLGLPLAILSANAAFVRNCNYSAGLAWYLVLPGISVPIATAWGVALGLLPVRKRWSVTLGYLVVLGSIGWGFWRFYSEPPICQYDPFVGYFSGSLYDDHIGITGAFAAARLYHLAGAVAVLLVAARFYRAGETRLTWRAGEPRRGLTAGVLAAVAVVIGLYGAGGPLAYTVSAGNLARALGGRHETPHFVIHYPAGSAAEREIRLNAADAEFRWHQLRAFYGTAPARKIHIYYFADSDQKRRLYGAANVDMAKPWSLEVFLTQRPFPHPVLKHELAHVFSAVFGDRAFGVSVRWERWGGILPVPHFNPGLIEGSAVAADWPTRGGLTKHQWARAMLLLDKAPPLAAVMSVRFLASAAGRSYTLAGSFCRFLVSRYGAAPFRKVYKNGGDFRAAYGRPLGALEAQWKSFLSSVPLSERELGLARERFRPRPIFRRPCVHEVARLDKTADRLMEQGRYRAAARVYRKMCRYDPGDPGHLFGVLAAVTESSRLGAAKAIGEEIFRHPATTPPLKGHALRMLGTQAWREGQAPRARKLYAAAARYPLSVGALRSLKARLMALEDPRLGKSLRPLLARRADEPPRPDGWKKLTEEHPQLGLAHYLYATYLLYKRQFAEAALRYERAVKLGLPDERFRREAWWRMGRSYLLAFELEKARQTFTRLTSPAETQAVRLAALEWIERVAFWERHGQRFGLGKPAKPAAVK